MDQAAFSALGEPMSWDDYWQLPEELRAEYSDGRAFVTPAAGFTHQEVCLRLAEKVRRDLPAAVVALAVGWRLVQQPPRLRIPDLVILTTRPVTEVVEQPPLVAVEVLSTNRGTDLVRKATEYLAAGAGQYWIVDPRDHVIECFANRTSGWESLARLTEESPAAELTVAPLGSVQLSLAELLG